jgi:hypothetical protein
VMLKHRLTGIDDSYIVTGNLVQAPNHVAKVLANTGAVVLCHCMFHLGNQVCQTNKLTSQDLLRMIWICNK